MSLSANFPTVRPSLMLDFAGARKLDPRITFTRASTATFYDDHTVAKAEENLLTYSQDFDNAAWSKTEASVTANSTTAPDGTTTAETITPSTNVARHFLNQSFTSAGATYVWSVYAKPNGYNRITIRESQTSGNGATFDVSTGTVVLNTVSGVGSITSVGNGWYRCSMVATETSGLRAMQILVNSNFGSGYESAFAGDGTSGVYVWGAQVEQRSSVTAYTPTTTQAITNYIPVLQTAAADTARFDHNPTTRESLGLLVEESRTNLLTYSDQFDQAQYTKTRSSIVANALIAPDGTLSADKLVEDTSTNSHYLVATVGSLATATPYTTTVYAKAAERGFLAITTYGVAYSSVISRTYFNLASGTVGTVGSGVTASITPVGNGWFRCSATRTTTAAGNMNFELSVVQADNTISYTGDGWSGIFIWGAQLEAGSFATSYIPTTSAQVTRAADAASMTGTNFSSWYNASEGTIYADTSLPPNVGTARDVFYIADGTSSTRLQLYYTGSPQIVRFVVSNAGSVFITCPATLLNANKLAFAYKNLDYALVGNASSAGTDTTKLVPVVTQAYIGTGAGLGSSTEIFNGTIKKIAYYPKRLTNAQLQALTA